MNISMCYTGPSLVLEKRELLGQSLADHHQKALRTLRVDKMAGAQGWTVQLGENLLFDQSGLELVRRALDQYRGDAAQVTFRLAMDAPLRRDYYSLQSSESLLAITASRANETRERAEALVLALPASPDTIALPQSMGGTLPLSVPMALLMNYEGEFDLLFANQVALLSRLSREIQRSPLAWLRGFWPVRGKPARERIGLSYRSIHPKAYVHPTAVIEGAVVEVGAHVGAHCTVRYSLIGEGARLYDGAKVEFSVVGARSTLMHDLVLFRSAVEEDVFLIHGPYQFSYFQRQSSAFATILMDFRADGKAIQVKTPSGLRPYGGRFLGSVLGEGSKLLGGCVLAPGRIVPPHTWLSADAAGIHTLDGPLPARHRPVSPEATKRRLDEPVNP